MIYNLTALFSGFIREFIDNPFEEYLTNIPIDINGMFMMVFIVSNWPLIMHVLTFGIVGGVCMKIPPYYVFNNEKLEMLLEKMPTSVEELKEKNILSLVKVNVHGQKIIDILNS